MSERIFRLAGAFVAAIALMGLLPLGTAAATQVGSDVSGAPFEFFGRVKLGGSILEGYLAKNAAVRVMRRGILVGTGKIRNIQTNKQNADRAEAPSEFGAQIEAGFEPAQGDTLECFTTKTV